MRYAIACGTVAILLTGCGTVQNFRGMDDEGRRQLEVYGGVARTVDSLKGCFASSDLVEVSYTPLLVFDVMLSAIGDTLTLPVTLPVSIVSGVHDSIRDYYFPNQQHTSEPPQPAGDVPRPLEPERIHGGIL
jgi:uncharacterized protein YceK